MEVWVRKAETPDIPNLVELNTMLFREDAGHRDACLDQGWPDREGHGYFANFLSCRETLCLLAVGPSEQVFGYLAGYEKEGISLRPVDIVELESMYVREEYRGRGVGERLAREFFSWAESGGAERISVTAYASNERAISFYKKIGFRPKSLTLEAGRL